ncbi:MAG: hypothetical protein HS132_03010 [Planctomycetia bacterium]|nr:hypothetical protein [Planctomycetia bacterium]
MIYLILRYLLIFTIIRRVRIYRYRRYGNKYRTLREDIRRFLEIEFYTEKTDNELKALLGALLSKKKRLGGNSPLLPD